ncbi:MAG: hypothetical protein C0594_03820 [Marinilabiliales bacterium]|nr:MAG: hypothetical protein C0594_03820 [Marinilabiliales bacterium]
MKKSILKVLIAQLFLWLPTWVLAQDVLFFSNSVTIGSTNGCAVTTYTFTQKTINDASVQAATGKQCTITFPVGTDASTFTNGTFDGNGILGATATGNTIVFSIPSAVAAKHQFDIVLNDITNGDNISGNASVVIVNDLGTNDYASNYAISTTLCPGSFDGTFETGTTFADNAWTVVNDATNQWEIGTAANNGGSNGAYISNDGGTSNTYDNSITQVSHFYVDYAFPAGETVIDLSFDWKCDGESSYDNLKVFLVPTSTTPTAGTSLSTGQIGDTYYSEQLTWTNESITIDGSNAGSTMRLVFSWKNDGLYGDSPPIAVDNISITTSIPPDMVYASSTVTQTNTDALFPNDIDQEIIGIEVVTTGSNNPINLTSFALSTAGTPGSDNAPNDINNAKIYYTGTSSTFSTTTLFGTTASPSGSYNVTGTQTLSEGTNYFWLCYDISSSAIEGNNVDASISSITVDAASQTPSTTDPSGSRVVQLYCTADFSDMSDEWITNVTFNTINNNSGQEGTESYGDYTSQSTTISTGGTYEISVSFNSTYNQDILVWFDWNQDNDFDDADEEYQIANDASSSPSTYDVLVPVTALTGTTRMRVISTENDTPEPCPLSSYGETEDYTVNVVTLPMTYSSSTVTQNTVSDVVVGSTNQEVIGIEIVTSGSTSPIDVTSFTFNTTGCDAPTTDIENARLWYTGTTSTFATSAQVGSTIPSPNGSFTITPSQTLSIGTNYFWLTYDITSTAVTDNFIDAQCTSITVGGSTETPTVTNPAGNRQIKSIVIVGTGTTATDNPFDNYYENEKTQILFQQSELGISGDITHLAFDLSYATSDLADQTLSNLTINLKHTSTTEFPGGNFESMSGATTVFSAASYTMPSSTGWCTFDITDFSYNGADNLIVEVYWGDNGSYCSYGDNYQVNSTTTASYYVNYGVDDNTTPPTYDGRSYNRPNVKFTMSYCVENGGTTTAASPTLCSGSATNLTLSGHSTSGTSIQWEESTDGGSTWNNVTGGSGATTAAYTTGILTETTKFRAAVSGATCTSYSTISTVTVEEDPTAGTANAASNQICNGTTTSINLIGYNSNIQWQESADGVSGWTNVTAGSGETTSNYTTDALLSDRYYRAAVTNSPCAGTVYSNIIEILVVTCFSIDDADQSVCSGNFYDSGDESADYSDSENHVITLTPSTPGDMLKVTFTNFDSESLDVLEAFDGATTAATSIGTYAGHSVVCPFTIIATNGTGQLTFEFTSDGSVTYDGWEANISCFTPGPLTNNSVSSAQTICSEEVPAELTGTTPTGGIGTYTYQWQKSTDNTNWTDISGATNINYTPTALTISTYYRRVVTSGSYTSNSSSILITVNPIVTPGVTISADASTICTGSTVTFTATPTNGGTPSYQWMNNGSNVGTNSNTFSTSTLANYDEISCTMISNASCISTTDASSNTLLITITNCSALDGLWISGNLTNNGSFVQTDDLNYFIMDGTSKEINGDDGIYTDAKLRVLGTILFNGVISDGAFRKVKVDPGYTLSVNTSKTMITGTSDISDSVTNNGNLILLANSDITAACHWINNSDFTANSGSTVTFNSSINQNVKSNADPYYNLTIDNTGDGASLLDDITVNKTITFIEGLFNTDVYKVIGITTDPADVTGHNSYSYVNGNFRKYFASGNDYALPVGNLDRYTLAEIVSNTLSGITYLDAKFMDSFSNTGSLDPALAVDDETPYTEIATEGIWQIDPNVQPSSGSYSIKLWFDDGLGYDASGSPNGNGFVGLIDNQFGPLKRSSSSGNAGDWAGKSTGTLNAASTDGRTVASGFAQRNQVSQFSHFAIGKAPVPLPVKLISFDYSCEGPDIV